jgi:ribonuclease-3
VDTFFARRFPYRFNDDRLLGEALTHRSFSSRNNERLEFLGDAVLGMFIAEWLYLNRGSLDEGSLTRMRASLVRRETLAEIAREIELGESLKLGSGELRSGGASRDSILADCLEALIGAVYLDGGFEQAKASIHSLYSDRLADPKLRLANKDAKTRLQEYLQGKGLSVPEYHTISAVESSMPQSFEVECRVTALEISSRAVDSSRKRAEQSAAATVLEQLGAD